MLIVTVVDQSGFKLLSQPDPMPNLRIASGALTGSDFIDDANTQQPMR